MPRLARTDDLLAIAEMLLKAQLAVIEELRRKGGLDALTAPEKSARGKRKSQTDLAYEVLDEAGKPLHILEIVKHINTKFGLQVTRNSLISAMLKKVARGQQFVKSGSNTFGLIGRDE